MDRRTYLRSLGVAGVAATAGCLDGVANAFGNDGAEGTVLGPPEMDLSEASHPSYGDEFPSFSLPDPLLDEEISPEQFEGERAFLMTFIYTNCHDGSCPMLLSRLVHAQQAAAEEGLEDEVAFLAMTFDPERDTPEVLQEEAELQGADLEAGNWHFLRPESFEEAQTVLDEQFGLELRAEGLEEHDDHGGDDEDEGGDHENGADHEDEDAANESGQDEDAANESGQDEDAANESGQDESAESDDDGYDITHYNLIMLVNERGIVERAYANATSVDWSVISDDLQTVVEDE